MVSEHLLKFTSIYCKHYPIPTSFTSYKFPVIVLLAFLSPHHVFSWFQTDLSASDIEGRKTCDF